MYSGGKLTSQGNWNSTAQTNYNSSIATCHANSVIHVLRKKAEDGREGWVPGSIRGIRKA